MIYINEMYAVVSILDMSAIRLVNFVQFHDEESKLITAGIDGIFIFDFCYKGKYEPKHAAQIDPEGKSIEISLKNKVNERIWYINLFITGTSREDDDVGKRSQDRPQERPHNIVGLN
jgi:hypothetical protein